MFAGLILAAITVPTLLKANESLYYATFFIGICYAFGNPIKWFSKIFQEISLSLQLAKAQKLSQAQESINKTREDLHRQAEELHRQKANAENEIFQQQQKAQEQLRQAEDRLRKEREQFQREMQKQKSYHQESLNPKNINDAYKILGVPQGASLDECKRAYRHLCALFHPDKFARIDGILKQQAEESLKLVNAAWDTIESAGK